MNRIRIALFETRTEAEPVRHRLLQAGLRAEVRAESGLANLWFVSGRRAGARLEVTAEDAEKAGRLLRDWARTQSWLQSAIRCPECKSFRVDFPQFTEKSLLTNLTMGLVAELGFIEREYYCEECHCMWAKARTQPARVRAHLAPDYFLEDAGTTRQETRFRQPPRAVAAQAGCFLEPAGTRGRCTPTWRRNHPRLRLQLLGMGMLLPMAGTILLGADTQLGASDSPAPRFAVRSDRPKPIASSSPTYLRDVLPVLMGKCARCHNAQTILANWLDYETAAAKRWEIKRRVWDSWHGTYFKQPMPVANGPEAAALSAEERQLIRDWVENGAPRGVAPIYGDRLSKTEKIELGRRLFTTICSACHQPTGQGIPGRFPPLAGSDFLNADKHRAIKVVVNGLQGEVVVNGQQFNNAMPQFPLTDQDIAGALTFVYNSFGNSGKEVTPDEVRAVRSEQPEPATTAMSTAKVPEQKSPYE